MKTHIVRRHTLGDRLLDGSSVARILGWSRPLVLKKCQPVACDVKSKRPLFSLVECAAVLPTRRDDQAA